MESITDFYDSERLIQLTSLLPSHFMFYLFGNELKE